MPVVCYLYTCTKCEFKWRGFAGLDSADLVSKLRAAHAADEDTTRSGVDVLTGGVGDMAQLGIFEAFKVISICTK